MKCENCKYKHRIAYENDFEYCEIFGEDVPERYARVDGEGCICNRKWLERIEKEVNADGDSD